MRDKIVIGSRESVLAVVQAEQVRDYIRERYPPGTGFWIGRWRKLAEKDCL